MTLPPHSLDPLPEEQWDPQLAKVRAELGTVLNVHRVMARHPDLMAAWTPLRQHIATGGSLEPRHRELVILRVAHRTGVEYEWRHHVVRARGAGLTEEEIESVRSGPSRVLQPLEEALLSAVDQLIGARSINDETLGALDAGVGVHGVLDIITTVGMYLTLAMLINSAQIELEVE